MEKPFVSTREQLGTKYFSTGEGTLDSYARSNLGMITLLSDLQHILQVSMDHPEYWNEILNDVKGVLIEDMTKPITK